jgi:hypothetical protein
MKLATGADVQRRFIRSAETTTGRPGEEEETTGLAETTLADWSSDRR